jgi:GlpG protein
MTIRYNAPVTLSFSIISFIALILGFITASATTNLVFSVHPSLVAADPLSWLRLFTHVLGHANWDHLLNNLAFLLLLGPILEEKYGSRNVLIMIILTALITGLLHILLSGIGLNGARPPALLGASGIVFMFILLASFTNIRSGEIPLTFILIVAIYLTREILASFQPDNISHFAHIIGGACGSVFGFFMTPTGSARRKSPASEDA